MPIKLPLYSINMIQPDCNTFVFYYLISGIDLKVASKYFANRFSCGSAVSGEDEIVIQGDVKDDLFDVIPEKWPQVGTQAVTRVRMI